MLCKNLEWMKELDCSMQLIREVNACLAALPAVPIGLSELVRVTNAISAQMKVCSIKLPAIAALKRYDG